MIGSFDLAVDPVDPAALPVEFPVEKASAWFVCSISTPEIVQSRGERVTGVRLCAETHLENNGRYRSCPLLLLLLEVRSEFRSPSGSRAQLSRSLADPLAQ